MKLTDIIALAKQGYKPADIRELIALAEETSTTPSEDPTEPAPAPVIEPEPEEPAAAAETAGPEQSEMLDKVNRLEEKLKSLQENNTRRPRPEEPPKKSDEAILKDMVRRFM